MSNVKTCLLAALLVAAWATSASCFCFEEAGAEYGINPQILRAIAKVESNFNPYAVNKNSNGTYDFGLMQINSSWASTLGKQRWNNLGDACYNTKTGAWILAQCISKYGYNWKAIGCYNSQTPQKRDVYARKVFQQLQKVKPVEQEAAYTPLKESVELLVKEKLDGWVEQAAQGKKGEFIAKGRPYVPVPKEVLQEPPTLAGTPLENPLPASFPPPVSSSEATSSQSVPEQNQPQSSYQSSSTGVMP
ncbi:lytic transglycosylase domain-containing protein [Geomonas sp.]|uniref:lytic transglycosylase domain-containing protein n=1 Tax=Geomonas sp. TaxID=2651584 RepID=UPI002B4773B7|nr:lytic transglycosylase domain-containing protein [Geomonas sp.]HJV33548.1 lytic transglycosylase domain-containing protein [Geomonas sp.]